MQAIRRKLTTASAVAVCVGTLAGALAQGAQAAGPGSGARDTPTTWSCTNGDTLTVNLPPVFLSPGQGALTAPFPGFVTATTGSEPLGTYVVVAVGPSSTGPFLYFGNKSGLAANALTCGLVGVPGVWVIIAHGG